jgi:hypothetical protein
LEQSCTRSSYRLYNKRRYSLLGLEWDEWTHLRSIRRELGKERGCLEFAQDFDAIAPRVVQDVIGYYGVDVIH